MSDTNAIVAEVESCWQTLRREIEGIDLATPVYPEPEWTVRDVLMHCVFWNDEAVKSIAAFRAGGEYATDTGAPTHAAGLDALNQRVVEDARSVPVDSVWTRWVAAQDRLTEAVRALDRADLDREMLASWDERMAVATMVRDELGHETTHVDDVVTAVSAQEGDA